MKIFTVRNSKYLNLVNNSDSLIILEYLVVYRNSMWPRAAIVRIPIYSQYQLKI